MVLFRFYCLLGGRTAAMVNSPKWYSYVMLKLAVKYNQQYSAKILVEICDNGYILTIDRRGTGGYRIGNQ